MFHVKHSLRPRQAGVGQPVRKAKGTEDGLDARTPVRRAVADPAPLSAGESAVGTTRPAAGADTRPIGHRPPCPPPQGRRPAISAPLLEAARKRPDAHPHEGRVPNTPQRLQVARTHARRRGRVGSGTPLPGRHPRPGSARPRPGGPTQDIAPPPRRRQCGGGRRRGGSSESQGTRGRGATPERRPRYRDPTTTHRVHRWPVRTLERWQCDPRQGQAPRTRGHGRLREGVRPQPRSRPEASSFSRRARRKCSRSTAPDPAWSAAWRNAATASRRE